jgi:integrase/recombinase XerD
MTDLRVKMIEEMKLHRFSPKTQQAYTAAVAGLANFYNQTPDKISTGQIKTYLLYLLDKRKLAWSSCNVAVNGLRFFYTHVLEKDEIILSLPPQKTKSKLPEIFSQKELETLFMHTSTFKNRVLLMTTYSGGLRVSEVVHLRVSDIDSKRMLIRVDQGKGYKDRYTLLSKMLLGELRLYWQRYRPLEWLFTGYSKDRPLSIGAAQKMYLRVKRRAGIKKTGGIHTLRHCFATHLLEAGVDIRTIQHLMGHKSIGTTMRYVQVTAKKIGEIKSPLDQMKFQLKEDTHQKEEAHDDFF